MSEQFCNARVHLHLTPPLDIVAADMHTSRLQLNSAALWWFLNKLTPEERAEILGEYTKVLAMQGQAEAESGRGRGAVPSPQPEPGAAATARSGAREVSP
jgi:hypothetical protein